MIESAMSKKPTSSRQCGPRAERGSMAKAGRERLRREGPASDPAPPAGSDHPGRKLRPARGLCDHRSAVAARGQAGRAADRLSHARFLSRSRVHLQDRKPQRLRALRAYRPRASWRAAPVREMRAQRRNRGRQARPPVAGSGRPRRLCAAPADGRARGPVPGLRGLTASALIAARALTVRKRVGRG